MDLNLNRFGLCFATLSAISLYGDLPQGLIGGYYTPLGSDVGYASYVSNNGSLSMLTADQSRKIHSVALNSSGFARW